MVSRTSGRSQTIHRRVNLTIVMLSGAKHLCLCLAGLTQKEQKQPEILRSAQNDNSFYIYFQFCGLPWASHLIAVCNLRCRVSSRFASVIQSTYSFLWL